MQQIFPRARQRLEPVLLLVLLQSSIVAKRTVLRSTHCVTVYVFSRMSFLSSTASEVGVSYLGLIVVSQL